MGVVCVWVGGCLGGWCVIQSKPLCVCGVYVCGERACACMLACVHVCVKDGTNI